MKRLNKWLLPLCAGLLLIAAALLPPQLSAWRDGRLYGVHTEEMESVGVALTVPELPERIELLSRWLADPDAVVSATQELAGTDPAAGSGYTAQALYDRELEGLARAASLPDSGVAETFWEGGRCSYIQLYLRGDRVNVEYLIVTVWSREADAYMELVIDEESGLTLALTLAHPSLYLYGKDALRLGTAFVERLGVDYRLQDEGDLARFRLSGSYVEYVCSTAGMLQIMPRDEWVEP